MREIRLRTERKTQLLDITAQVQEALNDTNGAAAALVYVPHTTAGSGSTSRIPTGRMRRPTCAPR